MSGAGATPGSPWSGRRRGRAKAFAGKREAVLSAAARLMARQGYDGMSLSELAELLNISKPTLYHYVGGKEQLFAEIVGRSQQATIDFMRDVVEQETSGFEKLRRILVGYIEMVNSDFGTCLIFSTTAELGAETRARIAARAREANALIYGVIDAGEADGTLRVPDAAMVLHTLFGAANWTPNWFKPDGPLPLRAFAEMQADILLGGVRGDDTR
ncbi:MAG: TetR/AcrR family transcriptional regulator [Phenylobacterium sp.]